VELDRCWQAVTDSVAEREGGGEEGGVGEEEDDTRQALAEEDKEGLGGGVGVVGTGEEGVAKLRCCWGQGWQLSIIPGRSPPCPGM
jgi:hypothetical protein